MNIAVIPTILATTQQELEAQYRALLPLSPRIQIDVADGELVDGHTLPLSALLAYLTSHAQEFPKTQFDFHLMVRDWVPLITLLEKTMLHVHLVLPHYVARATVETTLKLGIVFSPEDALDTFYVKTLPAVQIMTVTPGKQGNQFIPAQLAHISALRAAGFTGEIILDGGITTETLPLVLRQPQLPSAVGVGSFLTHATSPSEAYNRLILVATRP